MAEKEKWEPFAAAGTEESVYTAGQALTEREHSRPATQPGPAITEHAFAQVIADHQAAVIAYCWRFTGREHVARELAQEVFLTLWKERDRYQERGALRLYLLRIARLRCLAHAKRDRSRRRVGAELELTGSPIVPAEEGRPDAERVLRALAAMKPANRELVILRYFHDLDLKEIAEVTGSRLGTVKSRLSRALQQLRVEMKI